MATFSTHPLRSPLLRPYALADERLARRVGEADEQAFTELYTRHHQALYRYCRAILRDDADAQDALQSTWTRALVALRDGRRDAPLRPWLYRIAHNEAISFMRRRNRPADPVPDRLVPEASAEQQVIERERFAMLLADLRALSDRPRGALVMRELNGLSHEEIASALDTSVAGAKQSIYEARRELAEFAQGRAADCDDICRRISDGDGRVLRGRHIRAHLRGCPACAAFAQAIGVRHAGLNGMLPLLPAGAAAALLQAVLAAGTHSSAAGTAAASAAGTATSAPGTAGTATSTTTTGVSAATGTGPSSAAMLGIAGKGTGLVLLAKTAAGVAVIGASVAAIAAPGASPAAPAAGVVHRARFAADEAVPVLDAAPRARPDRAQPADALRGASVQDGTARARGRGNGQSHGYGPGAGHGRARGHAASRGHGHGRSSSATSTTHIPPGHTGAKATGKGNGSDSHGNAGSAAARAKTPHPAKTGPGPVAHVPAEKPAHPAHPAQSAPAGASATGPAASAPVPSVSTAVPAATRGKSGLAPKNSHQ